MSQERDLQVSGELGFSNSRAIVCVCLNFSQIFSFTHNAGSGHGKLYKIKRAILF